MARGTFRAPAILLIGLILALSGSFGVYQTATGQSAPIECADAVPPAALPAPSPAGPVEPNDVAFPDGGGDLLVFAAASLTNAFEQVKADLESTHPDLSITYNFAGSQALVTQLSQGAEADVLATADAAQMAAAVEAEVVAGDPIVFARNRLAIVVPADNPADVESAADLAKDELKLVLAAPEVPVGRYARVVICAMGEDAAAYGDGFVEDVAANIVSNEENVRAVLTKVQLGEADAGIVYVTDVTSDVADDVSLIEIPAAVNVVAEYPIAPVVEGDEALARAFIAYLVGPEGQTTLREFGFDGQE